MIDIICQYVCSIIISKSCALQYQTINFIHHGAIIATFFCPADPAFEFSRFYELMKAAGYIIYPVKPTAVDKFRIGYIGRMDNRVLDDGVAAVDSEFCEMGVASAAQPQLALDKREKLAAEASPVILIGIEPFQRGEVPVASE